MLPVDLTSQRFGRLLVTQREGSRKGKARWRCRCDCGKECLVTGDVLRRGVSNSCGCLRRELGVQLGKSSGRHGEGRNGHETPEYRTWAAMLSRCKNPNHCNYPHYGARGISVCERWHIFENFLADMGRRPSEYHSIDRINNEGNYCVENCRWATATEQNNNKRQPKEHPAAWRMVTIDGVEKPLREWLLLRGLPLRTFYHRIAAGMTPEQALSQAVGH